VSGTAKYWQIKVDCGHAHPFRVLPSVGPPFSTGQSAFTGSSVPGIARRRRTKILAKCHNADPVLGKVACVKPRTGHASVKR
jgi:hypothetical protein